ncbi:NAD(P)-binding protein [Xylaria intraflava]|nr:NAD(P)-binding protein [Xylaria intraflava]
MAKKTIVLISGGNRGIGLEIIKALLEAPARNIPSGAPYHVYLGSRDLQKGKEVAAGLATTNGSTVAAIQLDITSPESVDAAVAEVKADSGRVDVLINNAGANFSIGSPLSAETMKALYDLNVVGPSRMTDAFRPLLLAQPSEGSKVEKRLIHVTSSLGSIGARIDPKYEFYDAPYRAYRCSKAALGMLTACHAYEFKDDGVKVHAFDPGLVATDFGASSPDSKRAHGAVEPQVPGLACRDILEGKRDDQRDVIVSIKGDTFPF